MCTNTMSPSRVVIKINNNKNSLLTLHKQTVKTKTVIEFPINPHLTTAVFKKFNKI